MNLNQVTIPVSDITRSIMFYQTLGLKLIVSSAHYARFECPSGESTFSIHLTDSLQPCSSWIYFELEDIDAYATQLTQKRIVFEEMPEDKPWLWREARLKDPDGHTLILYHAGENRKNPPWRLRSEC
jgi:catechol 2,3-dioxygenase-like lactoylglutathione lyase family enzyme